MTIAKNYIYIKDNKIIAFISIINNQYIGALFVDIENQGQQIGGIMLDFIKTKHPNLTLNVYSKNKIAVNFYIKNHFQITGTQIDEDTNEEEYTMMWVKKSL